MSGLGEREPGTVRVVTQNLWGWYYFTEAGIGRTGPDEDWPAEWRARQRVLAAGFRELAPDLVAFQEAVATTRYDHAVELLGPGYHIAHQKARQDDGSGATVASRWPIEAVHEIDLHVTERTGADFPCVALVVEVAAPVGPTLLVSYVPNWELAFEEERERQAVVAARAIEELAGDRHVVVAGDFNVPPEASSARFWRGLQALHGTSVAYRDVWDAARGPGHTFTPENRVVVRGTWPQERGRRMDCVLVRCVHHGPTLAVAACARVFDEPVDGVWGSDHFGVAADLCRPAREPATLY
jgi:endonuclease/exonuclease/phosphatase family metal-dependent hydrolase